MLIKITLGIFIMTINKGHFPFLELVNSDWILINSCIFKTVEKQNENKKKQEKKFEGIY